MAALFTPLSPSFLRCVQLLLVSLSAEEPHRGLEEVEPARDKADKGGRTLTLTLTLTPTLALALTLTLATARRRRAVTLLLLQRERRGIAPTRAPPVGSTPTRARRLPWRRSPCCGC